MTLKLGSTSILYQCPNESALFLQAAYKSQQIARKAGSHWRRWAAHRAARRRGTHQEGVHHHRGTSLTSLAPTTPLPTSHPEAQHREALSPVLPRTTGSPGQNASDGGLSKPVSAVTLPAALVRPVPATASPQRVLR